MKQNRKALKAEIRKELAKEYKQRYETRIEQLVNSFRGLNIENKRLREQNDELTEKVQKYEDWNTRLLEFCNLPEDERKEVIQNLRNDPKEDRRRNPASQILISYLDIFLS